MDGRSGSFTIGPRRPECAVASGQEESVEAPRGNTAVCASLYAALGVPVSPGVDRGETIDTKTKETLDADTESSGVTLTLEGG